MKTKKTYAIITYAGTHHLIDNDQEFKLRSLKPGSTIYLDGNRITGSNIAEVLTIGKYYETYPDKRPIYKDVYKTAEGLGMDGIVNTSRDNALASLKKGLKKYINSNNYQGKDAPKKLLNRMEIALKNNG